MTKVLFMRYNSDHCGFCLTAACQNVTQEPAIVSGDTIGRLHGVHPFTLQAEDDQQEGADITNAMALLCDANIIAGTRGHFMAQEAITAEGRIIENGDPIYQSFGIDQGDQFFDMMNSGTGLHNTFFFAYCSVILLNPEGNQVTIDGEGFAVPVESGQDAGDKHWIGCWKWGDRWLISGGEKHSRLKDISNIRLMGLFFTEVGREVLGDAIAQGWETRGDGLRTKIVFDQSDFVLMPKIQLRPIRNWDNVANNEIRNASPWPTVNAIVHTSNAHHTMMIVSENQRNDFVDDLDTTLDLARGARAAADEAAARNVRQRIA